MMTAKQVWATIATAAICGVLGTPIIIYQLHFGTSISSDHTVWAEMGAAMSGIYAPILGALTLIVLWQQHKTLQSQNNFIRIQHIIATTSMNADGVLQHLEQLIKQPEVAKHLFFASAYKDEDLDPDDPRQQQQMPKSIADEWQHFYVCTAGLADSKDIYLQHSFRSIMRQASMRLGATNCRSLDGIAYVNDKILPYYFREALDRAGVLSDE